MSKTTFSTVANKKVNILLFGETGSGKSTTVNALANYFKFASFDEANEQLEQLSVVCPVQFALPDPDTRNTTTIKLGDDDPNERFGNADSVTQGPVGYQFLISENVAVHMIDTPGMGDTNGTDVDKHNFEKIMCFLKIYAELSAIIFIVDGCNSRRTHFFKYCITELLNNLHQSITANIMFCFTHSRNSMYGPGEGFKTIQELLAAELKSSRLQMNIGVNCFFVDNDAFRYLVAKKQGYYFKPEYNSFFRLSWDNSVEQMERMFVAIQKLPVHNLDKSISYYSAKKVITELVEPIVQLQKNIQQNIAYLESRERELVEASPKNQKELARTWHLNLAQVEIRELSYPSTVCTARSCVEFVRTSDYQEETNYKTRCHENCMCFWVTPNVTYQWMLYWCKAFHWNGHCSKCGCSMLKHMHIAWKYVSTRRQIIGPKAKIDNKEDANEWIKTAIKEAQQYAAEFKVELKTIQNINAKFACLLSTDSCLSHKQPFDQYIDLLISVEKEKENPQTDNLEQMKRKHMEEVRMLMEAIDNGSQEKIRVEDVPKYREELFQLKHCGPAFKQMCAKAKSIREKYPAKIKNIPIVGSNDFLSKLCNIWK